MGHLAQLPVKVRVKFGEEMAVMRAKISAKSKRILQLIGKGLAVSALGMLGSCGDGGPFQVVGIEPRPVEVAPENTEEPPQAPEGAETKEQPAKENSASSAEAGK